MPFTLIHPKLRSLWLPSPMPPSFACASAFIVHLSGTFHGPAITILQRIHDEYPTKSAEVTSRTSLNFLSSTLPRTKKGFWKNKKSVDLTTLWLDLVSGEDSGQDTCLVSSREWLCLCHRQTVWLFFKKMSSVRSVTLTSEIMHFWVLWLLKWDSWLESDKVRVCWWVGR